MFDLSPATIFFQIVNFLVLLGVLSWFFYRPVRKAIEERDREIKDQIEQARQREQEAEARLAELETERQRARVEADNLLRAAREASARERTELLDRTHEEAERVRQDVLEQVHSEEQAAETRLARELRQTAVSIAGDLIRTAGGPAVHETLVEQFLEQVTVLDAHQRELIREAMAQDVRKFTVETAYPLDAERQDGIRERLGQMLSRDPDDLQLVFAVRPELIAGLRFVAGTAAIDLSLSQVLDQLSSDATPKGSEHELGAETSR